VKLILAGKYESAIVRAVDADYQPMRNNTSHPYYVDLNRITDKRFFDGAGTFMSIANETYVPLWLDWNFPYEASATLASGLSLKRTPSDRDENEIVYREIDKIAKQVISKRVLSRKSLAYIRTLDLSSYEEDEIATVKSELRDVTNAYLRRLLVQVYMSFIMGSYLLICENDVRIVADIGTSLVTNRIATPLPFPDLTGKLLNPDLFANGILNFSPIDLNSLVAVREDKIVQKYAASVREELKLQPDDAQNDSLNNALIATYRASKASGRFTRVLEIGTWVVKPLHYVPIAGEILTLVEDVKDAVQKGAELLNEHKSWHMIGVRMHEVSVIDYLNRISNKYPDARN